MSQTMKQLAREGKLTTVISAIVNEMESDCDNDEDVDSADEFWKNEPIEDKPPNMKFVFLLPFEEDQISNLKRLREINMDDRTEFFEACEIQSQIIKQITSKNF